MRTIRFFLLFILIWHMQLLIGQHTRDTMLQLLAEVERQKALTKVAA